MPNRFKFTFGNSRLSRLVLGLNLLGLLVLVVGALALNEFRQGLVENRKESLTAQADTMAEIIAVVATVGDPQPYLEASSAHLALSRFIPKGQRARLFNAEGELLSDSYVVSESVDVRPLPPARDRGEAAPDRSAQTDSLEKAQAALSDEVKLALGGTQVTSVRLNESGKKVVSVSIPIRRVKMVLGVLTLEAGDVDAIVAAQRMAMLPFILVAVGVSLFSALLVNWLVSRPIQRLSAAADSVRMEQIRAISLPDLETRKDEIGTLARSLESMTDTLSKRMDAIDRFAADVSHEIKNPLTSIRSALETLNLVKDDSAKERLMNVINQDVHRLDRLITDISNASRLDAELSRDAPKPVEIGALMEDIVSLYTPDDDTSVRVVFTRALTSLSSRVIGREGPLGQVFRNLIDNARSFSPPGSTVHIHLGHSHQDPSLPLHITIDDEGPGIPEDNLETIFERFYTSRPKGTLFGRNSGLGLSISRQIIAAHHGRIWAENRKDEAGNITGARFTVALPNTYGPL
ncbi:sensor N-terminal transmembrane domain-containing protein [Asticcacaulis sp. SL142]|uniref:sensor histidine kinase n=1 Tax=Asticcacaulis sp. SL142 TaxID=2995155 RepID=UPI00226CA648|nr:ATP-binding protein [Asticcacaulis sp. SL142]WAC47548.1 sensor N-terminal transmembrane domain-containing protein [Asticcacaulis sp. SL142]